MTDLILRPSSLSKDKPWVLQIRDFSSGVEVAYTTVARLTDGMADAIAGTGGASWLFDCPEFAWSRGAEPIERSKAEDALAEEHAENVRLRAENERLKNTNAALAREVASHD